MPPKAVEKSYILKKSAAFGGGKILKAVPVYIYHMIWSRLSLETTFGVRPETFESLESLETKTESLESLETKPRVSRVAE